VDFGQFQEGSEIIIAPLPLYHIFCLTSTLSFMKWGSLIVLITNPRDLPALVKELGRWKFTGMTGVNTLFNGLLNTPGFDQLDFSMLKVVVGGGAAVQKPVAERWQQVTGSCLTEAYGLTETSPGVCAVPSGLTLGWQHRPAGFFDGCVDPQTRISRSCRHGPAKATSRSAPVKSAFVVRR
jgi:acyl-CoA synthetase (AMP-forming)/AMP-acid ligase II